MTQERAAVRPRKKEEKSGPINTVTRLRPGSPPRVHPRTPLRSGTPWGVVGVAVHARRLHVVTARRSSWYAPPRGRGHAAGPPGEQEKTESGSRNASRLIGMVAGGVGGGGSAQRAHPARGGGSRRAADRPSRDVAPPPAPATSHSRGGERRAGRLHEPLRGSCKATAAVGDGPTARVRAVPRGPPRHGSGTRLHCGARRRWRGRSHKTRQRARPPNWSPAAKR